MALLRKHVAIYGNLHMERTYCRGCRQYALVTDGEKLCCGKSTEVKPSFVKRMSSPNQIRRRPSRVERERLLDEYNHSCAYCEQRFDSIVEYHKKQKLLRVEWDHQVPWIYNQDNRISNFLPTCQFCNGWKSDKMFRTIEEVMIYVQTKWEAERVS